ncbi:hypothetical protein G6F60_015523 [Rhizopus arrhizus]|nr:hypothetical protein G6F60_015523 [Rhizopus arrhizus]
MRAGPAPMHYGMSIAAALGGMVARKVMTLAQQQSLRAGRTLDDHGLVQRLAAGQIDHLAGHRLCAGQGGQRKQAQQQPTAARTPH